MRNRKNLQIDVIRKNVQQTLKLDTIRPRKNSREERQERDKSNNIFYIKGQFNTYYEELEIVGEGCQGIVKRVKRIIDNKIFACKMIKAKDEETMWHTIEEFKHMLLLNHPKIVKVYELYVDELCNKVYTIMDFIKGESLMTIIEKKGAFEEKKACKIFKQLALAIHYMHSNSICHRDIKPDNILISEDNKQMMLTDFNISKFGQKKAIKMSNNVKMYTNTGTIQYLAPEILNDEEYTESVDIWSAGIVLYMMLCGEYPFNAEYQQDLILEIQQSQIDFYQEQWKNVSDLAKQFIKQLLTKDPQNRLTADKMLMHPWVSNKLNTSPLATIDNIAHQNTDKQKKIYFLTKLTALKQLGIIKELLPKRNSDCLSEMGNMQGLSPTLQQQLSPALMQQQKQPQNQNNLIKLFPSSMVDSEEETKDYSVKSLQKLDRIKTDQLFYQHKSRCKSLIIHDRLCISEKDRIMIQSFEQSGYFSCEKKKQNEKTIEIQNKRRSNSHMIRKIMQKNQENLPQE